MNRELVVAGLGYSIIYPERGEPPLTPPKEGDEELPLLNPLVISREAIPMGDDAGGEISLFNWQIPLPEYRDSE